MVGIIARLPHALLAEINTRFTESTGGFVMLVVELVLLFLVFAATIALVQATPQNSGTVCQTDRREQAIWRCTPVYTA